MRSSAIIGFMLLSFACNLHAAPQAIHEQGFVTIGEIEQWISIRGANSDNPVVLFLHGGPGSAMSAYADSMYVDWENDFTLVQWDQRGAGKTYGRNGRTASTLTLDRMTQDGVEVVEYLVKHLGKQRIVLVGRDFGSLLGVNIAKKRPDLLYAYVGTAQLVDMRANLDASYQRVFELAREFGDQTAIGELNSAGPPPWISPARWQLFSKWRDDFQRRVASETPLPLVRSPEYASAEDIASDEAGYNFSFAQLNFTDKGMKGPLMAVDLKKSGRDFSVPVYVVQGGADLSAIPQIAREYVEWIKAPAKEFIVVPKSGHADSRTSLDALYGVLRKQVKAEIARAGE